MIIQGKIPGTENLMNVIVEGGKISHIEPFREGTLHHFGGVNLMDGLQMARENGEKLFPEIAGQIVSGSPADIVLFEYQDEVRVKAPWVNGEKIEGGRQ